MVKGRDYHIHTWYQRCGKWTMTVPAIIRRAEEMEMTSLAITDHLNHFGQLDAFHYIKRDIQDLETTVDVYFGVELNFQSCDGEFAYNEEIHEQFGFEVVIGGVHSVYTDSADHREVLDIQHRHFMRTLENPLLDVLVHPFWFPRRELEMHSEQWWQELIETIPDDYIAEWARASRENQCAIEVNACAIFYYGAVSDGFKRAYIEMLARLRDAGAIFSPGSDAHRIGRLHTHAYAEAILDALGVPETQIFQPRHRSS